MELIKIVKMVLGKTGLSQKVTSQVPKRNTDGFHLNMKKETSQNRPRN